MGVEGSPERGLRATGITAQGPPPVGSVDLRFAPGIDVLYGRNGAGKSRLLRGFELALGHGAPVEQYETFLLHVVVDEHGPAQTAARLVEAFRGRHRLGLNPETAEPTSEGSIDELDAEIRRALFHQLRWHLTDDGIEDDAWLEALIDDLLRPPLALCLATLGQPD